MRKIHRWISLVTAVFLLIVAATGVVLQVQRLLGPDEDEEFEAPALALAADAYTPMFAKTLETAQARVPGQAIASIELKLTRGEPRGLVTYPGDPGRRLTIDPRDGKVLSDEPYEAESLIVRIHSGEILGDGGVVLGVLWGSALVVLSITGLWIYFQMYKPRKTAGKRSLFW